ncbi:AAA family ATPase [Pseudonocardia halophobica]|uniref:SARP family transcriptional regulator n=1 Tax=Pseudonocardia halophobica TaxID=29401 RepID=A0A9W6L3S6_9PSEU|nr:AAA family ATPase [Pseudonocardia halophobica]GLL12375.1 SARP family transcriptional regulator [Pseudonocardia halophobica]
MDTTVVRFRPAAGSPSVVIRLLGEVSASVHGESATALISPRMQRLIARVALAHGSGVSRDRLAAELWPDSSASQARTNLRKLLHDLRHSAPGVPALVDARDGAVRWCAGPSTWIDVAAFSDAVARGDLAEAADSYGGDLLPGLDDDWVVEERERLRRRAVEALAGLASAAEAGRCDDDVIRHTRRLLRLDPLHEPAGRLLMRAHARQGERSEALRTYERLRDGLERELGVRPEPATTALVEELRSPSPGPAFVGRRAEWQAALTAWEQAGQGRVRLLCVTGEAGIGKTRLAEELARHAAVDGHAVAYGRAYEAGGRPPWGPVIDWLRSGPVSTRLHTLDDACLVELARLLPELRAERPDLPDLLPSAEVSGRRHLLDAVVRGLLAVRRPLLLVVDDLQWCDADTLDLCGYLVQSAPSAPVLVTGTLRDDEVDDAHPVTTLRGRLARAGALSVIPLGPLDEQATAEMATLVGQREMPSEAAARLHEETEGNPLFISEAVRAGFGTCAPGSVRMTPTVRAVISARLDRLTPEARRLAEVAATIGREFTVPTLAAAAGRSEDDLTDDLDELWRRHIVRVRGTAYDFSHDRLRDVTLDSISPARRRKLHRWVAEALETQHAADLGPVGARLALHFVGAGLGSRAVEAYERAARHAYRVFALDSCIALLRRALRLLDDSPRSAARDEIELRLLTAMGAPLVARLGYGAAEVRPCHERALTLHRRLGRGPDPSLLRGLALHAIARCRFDRAEENGHALIAAGQVDRTARVEGDYVLGVTRFWRGEFAAAERHLGEAIARYRREDAPEHIARYAQDPLAVCLSRLALTQLFRGDTARADRSMRDALRVAAELEHPMTTGYVRAFQAVLAALEPLGHDLGEAVAALDDVTSTMHIGYFAVVAELLIGWSDLLGGDHRGLATMRRATDRMRGDQPLHLTFGLSLLARGHHRCADPATGRAIVAEALALTGGTGQRYLLAELLRIDAELLASSHERGGAVDVAERAVRTAVEMKSPWLRDRALATLSALGDG